jgi:hypothetical protein
MVQLVVEKMQRWSVVMIDYLMVYYDNDDHHQ